ncbi:MAG TPA: 2-hydroxy-3-oxopropionate reductase [Nitrosomonas sp.]|nr:2-hydroxy-3-oxopropionate reductase [Nitrosomonas sp.]HQX14654.1 2-hydroxy-3-oxopropionate reductase [Nitrosomonas sp.]HRB33840.1 2-hydroxy-3-oxopropionate reductase [Nitrosomonas sp.]HRB46748.1 2-hydroxy-3-oxopropionate reductase [Nitrosomonas sp.]HRB78508.1 2-hydroxy-3-oxopropionate reductase [Nitrosomonas sp.]
MKNIGFIGLGIMGKPMAGHLIKAGHRLFLHSRSGVPEELIEQGGQSTTSPKEVAERADVIFTMLPDTPDVEKVLFGEQGIAQGLQSRKDSPCIVVDMSSIAPLATIKFAERIKALGHEYVDAPVSGGDVGAKNATLTIMVGANQTVFETVKPLFELMGKTITHVGENGAGQICKVANQILVSITIEAVAEALLFAAKAGADPHKVREALMGGFAASKALEVHGARMLNRQFDPGFRVELHHKDLNIALATASALGVSLPNTATVRELFAACLAHDGAKWDNSAIIKMLEKLSNYEIPTYSK